MIRPALNEDIPAIVEMVGLYRAEVRPDLAFDRGAVRRVVSSMIEHARGLVLVVDLDGLAGVLIADAAPAFWWFELEAQVRILWIARGHRGGIWATRAMKCFECWAKEIGAARGHVTWTGKDANAFFERQGYRFAQTGLTKDLG